MTAASIPTRRSNPALPAPAGRRSAADQGAVSAGNALGLPRTGVVIVASRRAAPALAAMIAAAEGGSPVLAGWVSLDGDAGAEAPWSLPRLGGVSDLPELTARLGLRAVVAMVCDSDAARVREVLRGTGLELRVVPPIESLLACPIAPVVGEAVNTRVTTTIAAAARAIDLGALIGRVPHNLDRAAVSKVLTGKRILITGAGGSIGSELARVAASFGLDQLILMERSENALFEIDRQMKERHPGLTRRAVLHDVTDADATHRLLADLRPHVVFHAAAHKHVPLMEDHPGHAITNNLFGTKSIADAAVACRAERFVMISSDKAVNPTSVMGATKRLAELYVRGLGARAAETGTRLSMVRFGNVLGSACSVLTIWSSQIAEFLSGGGGATPITITDPRMTRYFMTIPEAATLVVQSTVAASADQVAVYVLDMGEPIRIVDLASRFVRAHGLSPRFVGGDMTQEPAAPGVPAIDIVFTGARPGEKLHEELAYAAESLRPTSHPGIGAWAGPGFGESDVARVNEMVAELGGLRFSPDRGEMLGAIRRYVPEMRSPATGTTAQPIR